MAVLQRIRNHSVALLVIVGFAMAAFIVGDLLTSSSSIMQSTRDKVVTINGEKVTNEQFETARQRKIEFAKAITGREIGNNETQQITQGVYNEIVMKALLKEAGEKLGLAVSADEINELVQGSHISPVLTQYFGEYAKQVAMQFTDIIVNDRFDETQGSFYSYNNWMVLEDEIASNRLMEKYQNLVKAAVQPNKLEAKDNFEGDNEECSFAYVKLNANNVADADVKVSSDDVKKYYNATKRTYKIDNQIRSINYISVQLRPSQADFDAVLEEMEAVREEFSTSDDIADLVNSNSTVSYLDAFVNNNSFTGDLKTFVETGDTENILEPHIQNATEYMMARIVAKTVAPDSMQIALVVVPSQAEADSLKAIFKTDADKALAGYDQQQAFNGWVTEAFAVQQFDKEIADKIFTTGKGGMFEHTVSMNGVASSYYYVGKVLDQTKAVAKSKVAVYSLEVTPSSSTRRDEFGKLNQFLTENKTIKQMQDSASSAGYFMMPTTIAATNYNIGQVADARQAVRFVFQNDKGDVSEIFECDDNLLVVAITGDIQEGYYNLNDTTVYKNIANSYPIPQAKLKKLAGDVNAAADKSLAGIAQAFDAKVDTASFVNFNLTSISGIGAEPAVLAAATKAAPGSVVGPIAGRNSVVLLQVIDKNNKDLEYDEAARLQSVARGREYMSISNGAAANALLNSAKVEDNRINFY